MLVQLARRRAGELVYQREIVRLGKAASISDTKVVRQLGFLVDRTRSAKVSNNLFSWVSYNFFDLSN